jgi:hypothetical protein
MCIVVLAATAKNLIQRPPALSDLQRSEKWRRYRPRNGRRVPLCLYSKRNESATHVEADVATCNGDTRHLKPAGTPLIKPRLTLTKALQYRKPHIKAHLKHRVKSRPRPAGSSPREYSHHLASLRAHFRSVHLHPECPA